MAAAAATDRTPPAAAPLAAAAAYDGESTKQPPAFLIRQRQVTRKVIKLQLACIMLALQQHQGTQQTYTYSSRNSRATVNSCNSSSNSQHWQQQCCCRPDDNALLPAAAERCCLGSSTAAHCFMPQHLTCGYHSQGKEQRTWKVVLIERTCCCMPALGTLLLRV
jgi:hypothetical protein